MVVPVSLCAVRSAGTEEEGQEWEALVFIGKLPLHYGESISIKAEAGSVDDLEHALLQKLQEILHIIASPVLLWAAERLNEEKEGPL